MTQEKGTEIWVQDLYLNSPWPDIHYKKCQYSAFRPYSWVIVFYLERPPNKLGVQCSILKAAISVTSHPLLLLCLSPLPCPRVSWLGISFLHPYLAVNLLLSSKGTEALSTQPFYLIKGNFVVPWAVESLGWEAGHRWGSPEPAPGWLPVRQHPVCSWDTRQMFFGAGTKLFVESRELISSRIFGGINWVLVLGLLSSLHYITRRWNGTDVEGARVKTLGWVTEVAL